MTAATSPFLRAVLLAALVGGCSAIGPTGTNKSTTAIVAPDGDGFVVLKFKNPTGASNATFKITNLPADTTFKDPFDDSPDGGAEGDPCADVSGEFCVAFKPDGLPSNVYLVDVILDAQAAASGAADEGASDAAEEDASAGTKAGTLAFVVKNDVAASDATDEGATPAADEDS